MTVTQIYVHERNEDMFRGSKYLSKTVLINRHKTIVEKIRLFFNKNININYMHGEKQDVPSTDSISVNMWSTSKDNPNTIDLSGNDEAYGYKYCNDGVFIPKSSSIVIKANDVALIEYDEEKGYINFLYDVCEFGNGDEIKIMEKLVDELLLAIAGSEEEVKNRFNATLDAEEKEKQKALVEKIVYREKEKVREAKQRIDYNKENISAYKQKLKSLLMQVEIDEKLLLTQGSAVEDIEKRLIKEFEIMKSLDKVERVVINEKGNIVVTTKTIYANVLCDDGVTRRYLFGEYEIHIDLSNNKIKFYNLDDDNKRYSAWGNGCHHPHVSETGSPCLGNASSLIADLTIQNEWGTLVTILINYLESVNLDDVAGRYYSNWDEVDEEGNIINEGSYEEDEDNYDYEEYEEDEDNYDYEEYDEDEDREEY